MWPSSTRELKRGDTFNYYSPEASKNLYAQINSLRNLSQGYVIAAPTGHVTSKGKEVYLIDQTMSLAWNKHDKYIFLLDRSGRAFHPDEDAVGFQEEIDEALRASRAASLATYVFSQMPFGPIDFD
jgi:hypothetical protein